jgi:hypothetical protein
LRVRALQIFPLALDQVLAMLDGLLEPRDVGADAVVAALDRVEPFVAVGSSTRSFSIVVSADP